MSFQQGLSGLNAAARQLDVIGNNVANASTVESVGTALNQEYTNILNQH